MVEKDLEDPDQERLMRELNLQQATGFCWKRDQKKQKAGQAGQQRFIHQMAQLDSQIRKHTFTNDKGGEELDLNNDFLPNFGGNNANNMMGGLFAPPQNAINPFAGNFPASKQARNNPFNYGPGAGFKPARNERFFEAPLQ